MRTRSPGQSALLLLDVIQVLNKFKVSYAIIGAFAASFYGIVRASLDADAVISINGQEDAKQLCAIFKEKGLRVEYRRGDLDDPVRSVINIQDDFYNRVDLLTGIKGMEEDVFKRVKRTKFMGCSIKLIKLEDFIAMKIFAGSPKDIQDVIGVLEISAHKIYLPLLKKIAVGYGRRCLNRLNELLKEYC